MISIFNNKDFYSPIKITFTIAEEEEGANYVAYTNQPVYYPLRDPNSPYAYAYPSALAKQLDTNVPIDFDKNRDFDIKTTFGNRYLTEEYNITPTMVHEILHGLGFCSMLKRVDKGVIGDNLPDYGGDYYMPALLSIEDKVAGKMTIKGFLPVNVYEKYFVDIDNPDNYYFDDAFCSLSNVELNYDIHKPPYFIERNNLRNFTNYMESWTGMESGIRFYERSHQPQSVAFKTKSGKLLYICTFVNTSHPDLNHIASPNFRYHSSGKVDEDYKPDIAERIDHNFILYPYNVGLSMSNEEKN